MILKFGASNFGCFKDQVDISFENKDEVSQMICIEGANGSGKTTLLQILNFLTEFISLSFMKNEADTGIELITHFGSQEPSLIYVDFQLDNEETPYRYHYEVTVQLGEVVSEKLTRKKPNTRPFSIFERTGNQITDAHSEFSSLKAMTLRGNASTISTAVQYEFGLKNIRDYFALMLANVDARGYLQGILDNASVSDFSKILFHDLDLLNKVKAFLMDSDVGITDLDVAETKSTEKVEYYPIFFHGKHHLSYSQESSGTQTLYKALIPYFLSIRLGSTLIHDEFDKHLHSLLLPRILKLFEGSKAQLLFTTFNIDIMDELGKYKVYMVEKDDNESYAYRLDEVKGVRSDRPVSSYYKKGLLGGIPR